MGLLRRLANRAKDGLFLPPFDGYWRHCLRGKVLCLLYHRVDEPDRVPFLDHFGVPPIPPRQLLEELSFLKLNGAHFLTFADLRHGYFPRRDQFGVIISFDDCLLDTYTNAAGVLEVLDLQGVFFQSTALVEAPTLIWEHALYWHADHPDHSEALAALAHARCPASRGLEGGDLVAHLREAEPMPVVEALLAEATAAAGVEQELAELAQDLYPTRAYLRAASQARHEIGSHGHHHYPRHVLDAAAFEAELIRSKELLGDWLGKPPRAFSYPFNSYLPGDGTLCARHYTQVATVDARPIGLSTSPLAIPRYTWPGPHRHRLHFRRWLWTGHL
jgi:peptidoglycan/xylan/chitin deacetylase (PgdA/CDA1 family)